MAEKKRIQYIDVAKFLGLLGIVFFHGYKECFANAFTSTFLVPLFFFLNGMTLRMDNISCGDFLVKKLKGYAVPAVGLCILCVLFDAMMRTMCHIPLDDTFFLRGIAYSINQTRFLALWFLTALFFSDVFLFVLYRKFKGNIWLTGLGVLAVLGFGIVYNMYYKVMLVWNIDAAFFGIVFTYFGHLFTHKNLSFLYQPLMKTRWIPLLVGLALMVGTYFLCLYILKSTGSYLIMFQSRYCGYYLTLPCALMGALGFTLTCRGISNFVLAYPVKFNLSLLAIHQALSMTLFRNFIVRSWWIKVANFPPENAEFILFVLTMTLFSLVTAAILYAILIVTPFSFLLNKPRYPLFEKIYSTLSRTIKARS